MLEPPVSIERAQHAAQRGGDALALGARHAAARARVGRTPRQEERLVRVDVADAGEHRLVEQQALDRDAAPAASRRRAPRPRARARRRRAARGAGCCSPGASQQHLPELAHVAEQHLGAAVREARGAGGCARRARSAAAPRARATRAPPPSSRRGLATALEKSCPVMPRCRSRRLPSSSAATRYLPRRSSVSTRAPAERAAQASRAASGRSSSAPSSSTDSITRPTRSGAMRRRVTSTSGSSGIGRLVATQPSAARIAATRRSASPGGSGRSGSGWSQAVARGAVSQSPCRGIRCTCTCGTTLPNAA